MAVPMLTNKIVKKRVKKFKRPWSDRLVTVKEKEVGNNNAESAANTVKVPDDEKSENQEPANKTPDAKPTLELKDKPEEAKTEKKKRETQAVVDKELLQASKPPSSNDSWESSSVCSSPDHHQPLFKKIRLEKSI